MKEVKKTLLPSELKLAIAPDDTYLLFSQKIRDDASSTIPRHLGFKFHRDLQDGAEPIHPSVTQRQHTALEPDVTQRQHTVLEPDSFTVIPKRVLN